jgi:hypothetical protein
MYYDRVSFGDGVVVWREIAPNGRVTRYCDDDGNDVGRLHEPVSMVDGSPTPPVWALPDPEPEPPPEEPPLPARRLTKLSFVGRLGADFASILTVAKANVEIELFVKMLDWATPDPDGTSVDLDDPRVVYALNRLEEAQVLAPGRAQEILGV